jgi:hypothetical protein
MNINDRIEKLAALSRQDRGPAVDVAGAVLKAIRLHAADRVRAGERQMMWFAVCSSAAAVIVAAVVLAANYYSGDAVTEVSQAISWVVQ